MVLFTLMRQTKIKYSNKMKHLVKQGKKIIGFVYQSKDSFYYAFGRPSQDSYISFACKDVEAGISKIKEHSGI